MPSKVPKIKRQKKNRRGRRDKYPWDQWMDKAKSGDLILVRGTQFPCQSHGMAQLIRKQAAKRNLVVHIQIDGSTLTVNAERRKRA